MYDYMSLQEILARRRIFNWLDVAIVDSKMAPLESNVCLFWKSKISIFIWFKSNKAINKPLAARDEKM